MNTDDFAQARQVTAVTYDLEIGELFDEFNSFLNYCHYEHHDASSLKCLRESLWRFKEEVNKHFIGPKHYHFQTCKYHILEHYYEQVLMFGSLLNGDTDTPESYHTMIKKSYKNTNKKGMYGSMRSNFLKLITMRINLFMSANTNRR